MGLSTHAMPPESVERILQGLAGPDEMASAYPIPKYADVSPSFHELRDLRRQMDDSEAASEAYLDGRRQMNQLRQVNFAHTLARGAQTTDGFRERLTRFWADHFTVVSKNGLMPHLVTPYVEEAIRPNLSGSFATLLFAAVTHPMMVVYLDQARSVGPNSIAGQNNGRGLNENLAREILELHTLGVGGPYSQTDVRELAEALTGLSWTSTEGRVYRPRFAEPGSETLLGTTLSPDADIDTIAQALTVIAEHPATARHIATKLAVHFVSDAPDPDLVAAMEAAYLATSGRLLAVYEAMLKHPAAWAVTGPNDRPMAKVMRSYDFIQSSLRALGVSVDQLPLGVVSRTLRVPLRVMGQDWERPNGPNGWPEEAEAWITPQGMAGRITWAMQVPSELVRVLPDPRDFVKTALGATIPDEVSFAARAAEDRAVGIGLILSSAAFQRRL
ncbi:DUF1800 domain-containing protein [Flavimaricola marinus]|uniref:DUF1800 domain-containing protein n=1 Tax=Flavimaricola marinus TaxID=1819565 RepID=UPI001FEB6B90|nr:DUF1800 domain-containing protein [Flavimaricola marinus]